MQFEKEIDAFINFARKVGDAGLTRCSSGNISLRIGSLALLSGTGSWVPELKRENIAVCEIESGKQISGPKPSMECGFHLGVLRQRPDVNVVFHFQSPAATAIACMKEMPQDFNVTAEVPVHVGREIPVVSYFRPGSPELAEGVIKALTNHNSAILRKHGQVVCANDFNQAFERAIFLEMACDIILRSGGQYLTLSNEEINDLESYINGKK